MGKLHIVFGALLLAGCSAGMEGGEDGSGNTLDGTADDTTADVVSPSDSAPVGVEAPAVASGGAEESDKALCLKVRSGIQNPITVHDGNWGSYRDCPLWCPENSFAYNIAIKAMTDQGSFDDAAVTGIRLTCKNRSTGATTVLTANEFAAGSWLSPAYCEFPGKPIVSGRMLLEAPQGSGSDDTSTNGLKVRCNTDANEITVPSLTSWGTWRGAATCAAGTAVCGINTRLEGTAQDGGRDDTALNGLRFECCTL